MSTQKLTIELPTATCRFLQQLVESGQYANESEIILEALVPLAFEPAPEPGEPEYERWLKEEVVPAYDEMMANPDDVYTGEEVLAFLKEQREARASVQPALTKAG